MTPQQQLLKEKIERKTRRTLLVLDRVARIMATSDGEFLTLCNRDRYYVRTTRDYVPWGILLKEHGKLERTSNETPWDVHDRIYGRKLTKEEFERGLKNVIAFYESFKSKSIVQERRLSYLKAILVEHEATPYKEGEKQ